MNMVYFKQISLQPYTVRSALPLLGCFTRSYDEIRKCHRLLQRVACDAVELPMRRKLRDQELTKSLARTDELLAIKRDMDQARKQVITH